MQCRFTLEQQIILVLSELCAQTLALGAEGGPPFLSCVIWECVMYMRICILTGGFGHSGRGDHGVRPVVAVMSVVMVIPVSGQ